MESYIFIKITHSFTTIIEITKSSKKISQTEKKVVYRRE